MTTGNFVTFTGPLAAPQVTPITFAAVPYTANTSGLDVRVTHSFGIASKAR